MRKPTPLLLASALAFASLSAQSTRITPAFHVGVTAAQGDFRSEIGDAAGYRAAVSAQIQLTPTLAVRPTFGFEAFPTRNSQYTYQSARYSDRGEETTRWSAWTYGADCLYRPGGPQAALYFVAGAYMKVWRLHGWGTYTTNDRLNTTRTYAVDDTTTKNEPAVALGLGYAFNRTFALETRSMLASYRGLSYNTVELTAVISF